MLTQIHKQMQSENIKELVFENSKRGSFRERITLYKNKSILYERFCYGEAAGLVFSLNAKEIKEDGTMLWDFDACQNSKKHEAPVKITSANSDALFFDDKQVAWNCIKKKKGFLFF